MLRWMRGEREEEGGKEFRCSLYCNGNWKSLSWAGIFGDVAGSCRCITVCILQSCSTTFVWKDFQFFSLFFFFLSSYVCAKNWLHFVLSEVGTKGNSLIFRQTVSDWSGPTRSLYRTGCFVGDVKFLIKKKFFCCSLFGSFGCESIGF